MRGLFARRAAYELCENFFYENSFIYSFLCIHFIVMRMNVA